MTPRLARHDLTVEKRLWEKNIFFGKISAQLNKMCLIKLLRWKMHKIKIQLLICLSILMPLCAFSATNDLFTIDKPVVPTSYPTDQRLYDMYRNSAMVYYGVTENNSLLQVLSFHTLNRWPEQIQSFELAHTLDQENFLRRFVSPVVGVVQVAGNITHRNGKDENQIYEFDPYVIFRWANLPWNNYVNTSFALGEGVSYASSVPSIEKEGSDNTKRFLNYLMFEATFAMPSYPRLQVLARVHHRSGAYGLYRAGNSGSNDVGLGIRYLFD